MSHDLTRWNRAGLDHFRYVDGNAVIWLEQLRQELAQRFPEWHTVQSHLAHEHNLPLNNPPVDNASSEDTTVNAVLEQQYQAPRQDMLWELTRAFARSSHVLTETIDHYANEGYLGTATQWENVRRLVAMLDYRPAPPASASTWLVLNIKNKEAANQGVLDKGFAVKYSPIDGGESIIFETLEAIDVRADANQIHLSGWNQAQGTLQQADSQAALWLAPASAEGLLVGQVAIVTDGATAIVSTVDDLTSHTAIENNNAAASEKIQVGISGNTWKSLSLADTQLLLKPKRIYKPRLNGDNVVELDSDHSLVPGNVIRWKVSNTWHYAVVDSVDGRRVRLEADQLPDGHDIFAVYEVQKDQQSEHFLVPHTHTEMVFFDSVGKRFSSMGNHSFETIVTNANTEAEIAAAGVEFESRFRKVKDENISVIYWSPDHLRPIGKATEFTETTLRIKGGHGELTGDDWLVAELDSGQRQALQVDSIDVSDNDFTLTFTQVPTLTGNGIVRLYGPFVYAINANGADYNQTQLIGGGRQSLILEHWSPVITRGRALIIQHRVNDRVLFSHAATVNEVDTANQTIVIEPPLPETADYRMGSTVVNANVVLAGHGERRPERVLGSGDSTVLHQEFLFSNTDVSFVTDSTMSSGVRADIDVTVDGQQWQQVSTLNNSGPTDIHYQVIMTEDGYLRIAFGDGQHGRRLPTGNNNLRIGWRQGAGLQGNLNPYQLSKPLKPHYLIDTVQQPLPANGGGDMESIEQLRSSAPASTLTLERAVSLNDFARLAQSHSSVWQASAFTVQHRGRGEKIQVVVVPAGGVSLDHTLQAELEVYLQQHAIPGVNVQVSEYQQVVVSLAINIRVKTAEYNADEVAAAVKAELLAQLDLQQRSLGQPLYRAELYQWVEGITGVENSDCTMRVSSGNPRVITLADDDQRIRALAINQQQVIYALASGLQVVVIPEEYQL